MKTPDFSYAPFTARVILGKPELDAVFPKMSAGGRQTVDNKWRADDS
jgi:hypothetical protein